MGGAYSGGDRFAGSDNYPKDGLPSRPATFSRAENEYWTALLGQIPNDLLRRIDTHQLRTLCECMALRDVLYPKLQQDLTNKAVFSHYMRCVQQIQKLSPAFGLAPLDRKRMKVVISDRSDEIDEWSD